MPYLPVPPARLSADIDALFSDSSDAPDLLSPQGGGSLCASPLGVILSAHAPQPSGGGLAQGADQDWRSMDRKGYRNTGISSGAPGGIVSGYPDLGSIATKPSEKFAQIEEIGIQAFKQIQYSAVREIVKKFPLQEVGTGKLKYHTRLDGSTATFCGTFRPDAEGMVAACSNKPYQHQVIGIPNSCKRRACPECHWDWGKKDAQRVSSVLNGFLRLSVPDSLQESVCEAFLNLPENGDRSTLDPIFKEVEVYLPRHVIFSPDITEVARLVQKAHKALVKKWGAVVDEKPWLYRNEFYKTFLNKYRRKLDKVVRSAGIFAAVEVTHDIRLKSQKESQKADKQIDANRYRKILDYPDWRYKVKFSPHSHLQAFGRMENAEAFHARTGWVYVNYGTITNSAGLTKYLLSHAPDVQGKHSVRYIGSLNPARMSVEGEAKIPYFMKCEECLREGKSMKESGMVMARLESTEYHRDGNKHNHLVSWEFSDKISDKPYRTTKILQIYKWRDPDARPVGKAREPPPAIADWLSPEEKAERLRQWKLLAAERERIRRASLWVPWRDWSRMDAEKREEYKWRRYFTPEEYAELSPREKMQYFEWV